MCAASLSYKQLDQLKKILPDINGTTSKNFIVLNFSGLKLLNDTRKYSTLLAGELFINLNRPSSSFLIGHEPATITVWRASLATHNLPNPISCKDGSCYSPRNFIMILNIFQLVFGSSIARWFCFSIRSTDKPFIKLTVNVSAQLSNRNSDSQ